WGGWAGYSHYWLPNLHSNFTFGIRHSDYHSTLIGPAQDIVADKQLLTAHVNLIYAPVPFADVGIEYFWGQRQVVANLTGNISAVLTRVRMRF
ncbi:MAG TPA: DcaP family trimeric outer membrane transporter, partial [Stellaceae bacterium]|nr:DcaP family trimeric outer membrane transporter [Stellaceae bacterium]